MRNSEFLPIPLRGIHKNRSNTAKNGKIWVKTGQKTTKISSNSAINRKFQKLRIPLRGIHFFGSNPAILRGIESRGGIRKRNPR
jgi:hypothetical protein